MSECRTFSVGVGSVGSPPLDQTNRLLGQGNRLSVGAHAGSVLPDHKSRLLITKVDSQSVRADVLPNHISRLLIGAGSVLPDCT